MRDKESLILENLYLGLILEKDHRDKMIKFGIPEDVADYLHNFSEKYSIWFADKIKNMGAFQASSNKINWINVNLLTQMQGILDWIRNVPNINLKSYNWDQAVEAQDEYHKNIQIKNLEGVEKNTIIKKYSDGFYWVDLESTRDCSESDAMGHCGTTNKADTLYSLRKYSPETQTIEPFITMAISPDDGIWYQCKGKRNSKPKDEYHKYIADILIEKKCFIFKFEYDSSHDFTDKDLREYVEEHAVQIPNSDEILEKISDNNISYNDFKKVLDQYSFEYFGIDIDEDYSDESYVRADYSFHITLNYKEFPDIPNLKAIIEENGGEFYKREDYENFQDMLSYFDIYASGDGGIRIENSTNDENSFYVYCGIESNDNYFAMDDNGLSSFDSECNGYSNTDKRFDREEFIEQFKKVMMREGWVQNEYIDFVLKVRKMFVENNEINVFDLDKDLDINSTIISIPTLLFEYGRNGVMRDSFFTTNFTKHSDLSEDQKDEVPYAQYVMDFFRYFLYEYLNVSEYFDAICSSRGREAYVLIQLNLSYEDSESYNYDRLYNDIQTLINNKNKLKETYVELEDQIIVPNLNAATRYDAENTYIKEDDIIKITNYFKNEDVGNYADTHLQIYSKIDNKELGYTTIWRTDISSVKDFYKYDDDNDYQKHLNEELDYNKNKKIIDRRLRNKVEEYLKRYPQYQFPKYNKEISRNFLLNNLGGQMTFKDFIKRKKGKSEGF